MTKDFRKCLRFDAKSENNLKELYETENRISRETGRKKVSENQIVMDAIAAYHQIKCENEQLKKEVSEERKFYAQMNDKIISKYFNVLMDCLEGIATQLQDQELYIRLLSVRNDVAYLLESKGEDKLLKQIETDEKMLSVLKRKFKKEKEEKGMFENHEGEEKEDEADERKFL